MEKSNQEIFAERLRLKMKECNLSRSDIAKRFDVYSISTVDNWLRRGKGGNLPTLDTIIRLAKLLNTSVDYLCGISPSDAPIDLAGIEQALGLNIEAINFLIISRDAYKAPRGPLYGSPPGTQITMAGHVYDGFLDIINSLMAHQLKDIENLLGSTKRYVDAMQASGKNRKEITINCGKQYDMRHGTEPHEPSRADYLALQLERFSKAITHGEKSIPLKFADEHRQAIKDIRAARLDVIEASNALLIHFTEKMLERLKSNDLTYIKKEAADDGND